MTNETVKPEGTVQSSQAQPSAAATSGGRIARLSLLNVVLAVGLLTFGTALGYMLFPLHVSVAPPKTPAPPLNSSTDEDVILKTKLDYYEKRANDLQWLSSGMLALSALFATVAGITTYLSVSQSLEKSNRLVDEARENLAESASAVTEIRKEFPLIGDMNRNIMKILKELAALLDPKFLDKDLDSVFSKLSSDKRERIFFYEKTVAALSLLNLSPYSGDMAKIYRGLGIFFGSKAYSYGKPVHLDDLDRAIFYLDRSNAVDSETVQTLNDKAYFIMDKTDMLSLVRAEPILLRSIDLVDNQQRARNNLAYIYTFQKKYSDAVCVLDEALKRTSWESGDQWDDPARDRNVCYNYACALAGLNKLPESMTYLKKVFERPNEEYRITLKEALQEGSGDELRPLLDVPAYKAELEAILDSGTSSQQLPAAPQNPENPPKTVKPQPPKPKS